MKRFHCRANCGFKDRPHRAWLAVAALLAGSSLCPAEELLLNHSFDAELGVQETRP